MSTISSDLHRAMVNEQCQRIASLNKGHRLRTKGLIGYQLAERIIMNVKPLGRLSAWNKRPTFLLAGLKAMRKFANSVAL